MSNDITACLTDTEIREIIKITETFPEGSAWQAYHIQLGHLLQCNTCRVRTAMSRAAYNKEHRLPNL